MVKGIFVVLDGVADEKCSVLEYKTPLEAAKTPNLDSLAKKSRMDYCYPVKEGVVPGSTGAVVSLLGHDSGMAFRGPLEAKGAGIKLTRGDLALRVNFATVDDLENMGVLDGRAGRNLSFKESRELAKEVNNKIKMPFQFEFYPTLHHRGVLVFRGGFSDNITNADPYYKEAAGKGGTPKAVFSKALDDEEDSKLSANLVNTFILKSHEILDKHPLNSRRAQRGLFSANYLLCRDAGTEIPKFKKLKGKWMGLSLMPLEKGIIEAAKMDLYKISYPKMKGIDVYSNLYEGLNKTIKNAVKMLKKNRKKYDYFFIHVKETDTPGHDNKPLDKKKMIELIDDKLMGFLKGYAERNNARLLIASDHVTSCRKKGHTADSVPVLFFDPSSEAKEKEQRFTEEDARNGRKILGRKLLEKTLFVK